MDRHLYLAAAAALALACARSARAQDTIAIAPRPIAPDTVAVGPAPLVPGKHALSFGIQAGGGGSIGGWVNLTGRTQLGLQLFGNLQQQRLSRADSTVLRTSDYTVRAGVELRRFVPRSATVAPFVSGSVSTGTGVGHFSDAQADVRRTFWEVGAGVGAGVEWFPVPSVSVGGQVGVSAYYQSLHDRDNFNGGRDASGHGFVLSTGTSALTVKIYF